jgi:multicomponent Na+:H+ antiporter subunit F
MHDLRGFFIGAGVFLTLTALVYLYRVAAGPTVWDRLLGLGGVGTKTVVLILIIGAVYGRIDMFVDISIGYALLNFVGTLAAAKYFESRRET